MNTLPKKMYILVRKDLDAIYRMVQGSHALAEYAIKNPKDFYTWGNTIIIFLGTKNEISLKSMMFKLQMKGKAFSEFREEDLSGQITALACYDDGKIFKDLDIITV